MLRSGSGRAWARRAVGALLVTTVVMAGAPSSGAAPSAGTGTATGTPVKVGLLTTGGDCNGCSGKAEEPVARAAVKWLNATHNGLAGHPMDLDVCITSNDPGKEADCANQMVRDGVVAVIEGSSGNVAASWKILNQAGIALINHSTTDSAVLADTKTAFILYDPLAQTVTLPLQVAKSVKAKKVSYIVIDVPAATDIYGQQSVKDIFKNAHIQFTTVPVAIGTNDMSTQAQQINADNPHGVVAIIGHDAFCIPALNALNALGFKGTITTISFCITDAMRQAVQPAIIKGMQFGSEAPVGSKKPDPSMVEYQKVLKKYGAGSTDAKDLTGIVVFQSFGALSLGTLKLTGAVTPASVIAAMRSMDNEVLPASGGRVFRCNGKASSAGPSICSRSTVVATLDSTGNPAKYTTKNNQPVPN
jgi:branched-chain amino acid transport system substrate-binding protein